MLNNATRVFVIAAVGALVAAVVYGVWSGDRGGADLLVGLAAAAGVFAAVSAGAAGADRAPVIPADAPAPEPRSAYTDADVVSASPWPLIAAVDVAAIALAVGVGANWLAAAAAAAVVPALGWLTHVWREHPAFSPRVRERVVDRLIAPLGMPVLGVIGVLFIAAMVSRVLLAVPEQASTGTAFAVAFFLLVVLAFIASRPALRSSALLGAAGVALVAMVAAGAIGAKAGERTFEDEGEGPPERSIVAKGVQFSLKTITLPANTDVELHFTNRDTGTYHNVAFYTSLDDNRKPLWNGKPVPGGRINYFTRTPGPGTYAFLCDFHPTTMTGQLVIKAK